MEGLVPLGLLLASSVGLLMTKPKRKEHFGLVNPGLTGEALFNAGDAPDLKGFGPYVEQGAVKYSPIMHLINPINNPLLPPDYTDKDVQEANKDVRNALAPLRASPQDPSFKMTKNPMEDIQTNVGDGKAIRWMQQCERVTKADCNAFDDPGFAANCGICHEEGTNSKGRGHLGGIYVSEDQKADDELRAKRLGSNTLFYTPSVGTCKAERFSTNKKQCLRIERTLECQKKQNFSVPGCSTCIQDDIFRYLDEELNRNSAYLMLVGKGSANLSNTTTGEQVTVELSEKEGKKVEFKELLEGQVLQIVVNGDTASIAGYLEGETASGTFKLDIGAITLMDAETGARPRMSGMTSIGSGRYTVLKPGRGKNRMRLQLTNVFTFIAKNETESGLCPAAPFNQKEESARILNAAECYKQGQEPGKFSQKCMKTLYEASGCKPSGTLNPTTERTARALQFDDKGRALELGDIAEYMYDVYQTAMTGKRGEETLSVNEWNEYTQGCLGKRVVSPCDKYDVVNGPLGADCLAYLWRNRGSSDNIPQGIGPTYYGPTAIASLDKGFGTPPLDEGFTGRRGNVPLAEGFANTNLIQTRPEGYADYMPLTDRYCMPGGDLAPVDDKGKERPEAIAIAQSQGGVEAVREFYDRLSRQANDNSLYDVERKKQIKQCYGISFNIAQDDESRKIPIERDYLKQTMLGNPGGTQKTPFFNASCDQVITLTGAERYDPDAGRKELAWNPWDKYDYNKLFIIMGQGATDQIGLYSNVPTISPGTVTRVAYVRESSKSPRVLRVRVVSNNSRGDTWYYKLPAGMMGTLTCNADVSTWYAWPEAFEWKTEPFDSVKMCGAQVGRKQNCLILEPSGEQEFQLEPGVAGNYSKPIVFVNSSTTGQSSFLSNFQGGTVYTGQEFKIGYKKASPAAPNSIYLRGASNNRWGFTVQDGQMMTIRANRDISVWYGQQPWFDVTTEPLNERFCGM